MSYLLKSIKVKKLIIFSRDENKQFEMSKKLGSNKRVRFFIGDVRDESRLMTALRGVDYVIHAAAMKHVPASEYNPDECIKTNIDGAKSVITASIERKVKKLLHFQQTKLVIRSIYMEQQNFAPRNFLLTPISYRTSLNFRCRYGNVIGSRGSVIPYFKDLLNKKIVLLSPLKK